MDRTKLRNDDCHRDVKIEEPLSDLLDRNGGSGKCVLDKNEINAETKNYSGILRVTFALLDEVKEAIALMDVECKEAMQLVAAMNLLQTSQEKASCSSHD